MPPLIEFDQIDWSSGNYHVHVELDLTGIGNSYTIMGTTQLLSLPYALYAENTNNCITGGFYKGDTLKLTRGDGTVLNLLPCGIDDIETGSTEVFQNCITQTLGSNNDQLTIEIGYSGLDDQAIIVNNGSGTISGDDPALVENGTIIISGLTEGDSWDITIAGGLSGSCNLNSSGAIDPFFCVVQDRLDAGETPCEIVNSGVPISELYGKTYEGGLIFYVDVNSNPCFGLVAAPADSEVSGNFEHPWGCFGTDITGVPNVTLDPGPPAGPGAEIGDGATNTTAILTDGSGCITATGAASVASLPQGGYSDWFLPSAGELRLIYTNLKQKNLGNLNNSVYWSSTEFSSVSAWFQDFSDGVRDFFNKGISDRVRAVRAFRDSRKLKVRK